MVPGPVPGRPWGAEEAPTPESGVRLWGFSGDWPWALPKAELLV